MPDEEYDLVPHKEVLELKKQIEDIKKNPIESSPQGKSLIEVMTRLSSSMNGLVELFKEASQTMKPEESTDNDKRMKELEDKLEQVVDENKKIARGMIAIADMVRDIKNTSRQQQQSREPRMPPSPPRTGGPIGMQMNNNRPMSATGPMPMQAPPMGMPSMPPRPQQAPQQFPPPLDFNEPMMPPRMSAPPPMPPLMSGAPMPPPMDKKKGWFGK